LAIGTVFFLFTIPLAYRLAGVFSRAAIKRPETAIKTVKEAAIRAKNTTAQ